MPYTITASFDTAGRTMMGVAPAAFGALVEAFDPAPIAYGANCGVGASDLLAAILAMSAARPGAPLIAKANAGVPQWHGAHIHYSGTPELMATYAGLAVDCGARIIGGCCGNTPAHVAAMRRGLDAHEPGARPDVEAIVAALGALVAPPAAEARGADPPARAGMNAKAKRRAWSAAGEPEPVPTPEPARQPLAAPSGPQVFDVDAAGAGERLDRFLGRRGGRAPNRAVAHPAQGADRGRRSERRRQRRARSLDAARRGRSDRLRGAAGGRIRRSSARTCPLPSFSRTSI